MKNLVLLLAISLAFFSCKNENANSENKDVVVEGKPASDIAYASFGMQITDADALDPNRMMEHYKTMKIGDTINSKMKGKIKEVCSAKGCWMTLDMDGENQVMVKFKDYGFFMPLNAEGDVVVNGKAFVTETSVDELRHYAEDAGKSKEEVDAIREPKFEYRFEADGVLLKE